MPAALAEESNNTAFEVSMLMLPIETAPVDVRVNEEIIDFVAL